MTVHIFGSFMIPVDILFAEYKNWYLRSVPTQYKADARSASTAVWVPPRGKGGLGGGAPPFNAKPIITTAIAGRTPRLPL